MRFLFFVVAVAAGIAAAGAWREARLMRVEATRAVRESAVESRRAAEESAAQIDAARKTAAQAIARIDNLESQIDALRRDSRAARPDIPADGIDVRLAVVDLRLLADGDTAAAARSLEALAAASGLRADEKSILNAEAARLRETPSRDRALAEIAALDALLRDPPKTAVAGAGWRGFVADVLQIRRAGDANVRDIFSAVRYDLRAAAAAARARDDDGFADALDSARRGWRRAVAHLPPETAATGDAKMRVLESLRPPFYRLSAR